MATLEREIHVLAPDEVVAGGVPLATLAVSPDELAERSGIEWSTGSDDLGAYRGCVFETPSRSRFALVAYDDTGPNEIALIGHPKSAETLDDALRSLRVVPAEVVDRFDAPLLPVGAELGSAEIDLAGIQQALEDAREQMLASVERMRAELEITRLASLASIETAELTPRQRDVLELLASGLDSQEVADELGLSRGTVMRHFKALRDALVKRP